MHNIQENITLKVLARAEFDNMRSKFFFNDNMCMSMQTAAVYVTDYCY